jgi:hypothetical protein
MDADTSGVLTIDYELLATQLAAKSNSDTFKAIVEVPFDNKLAMGLLFLGFICLYIVDEGKSEIQLMAASGTEEYRLAVERYNFKPSDFHLGFDTDKENTIVRAIASGQPQDTTDWVTLSRKHSSPEVVRLNQANSGIAYTAIYPFSSPKRGALMYNFYQYPDKINGEQRAFMEQYTELAATSIA